MTLRTDEERLTDILDRIDRIKFAEIALEKAEVDRDTWEEAQIVFDAILYNLLVIGEAVKGLTVEITNRNSSIPWKEIAKMRDILAHKYFQIDSAVIRTILNEPLENLREICQIELDKLAK